MVRKKRAIKLVKNKNARNVTFCKRRKGIYKKGNELSVLCGARVGFLGLSPGGNPFAFGSPSFQAVIEEYLHQGVIEPFEYGEIDNINQELRALKKEIKVEEKKVEEIDKGKVHIVPTNLSLEELQKVEALLKELKGEIEAVSSLLLLAEKPVFIVQG